MIIASPFVFIRLNVDQSAGWQCIVASSPATVAQFLTHITCRMLNKVMTPARPLPDNRPGTVNKSWSNPLRLTLSFWPDFKMTSRIVMTTRFRPASLDTLNEAKRSSGSNVYVHTNITAFIYDTYVGVSPFM
ncbi:hypothetical protein ElyMa_002454000 [Elysia marginata]|uniref:Uncharacterized protein n=1 Tax=Elysia marginata TaxID=1093978 RepID=A0AAV4GKJ6_9GAST|nr:hypothetical protein ElyMa_002454000 [Elysia marginata]